MIGFRSSASLSKMLALALIVVAVLEVPAAKGSSQCTEEQRLLVYECRPVILGRNASPACCQRIRVTHLECVCPSVTPKLAALINLKNTIKQIEACGRSVPHNFKCGSITTP